MFAVVGCRTADPAFYTRDGRLLADVDPLPYRIALASFPEAWPRAKGPAVEKDRYWFRLSDVETHELLADILGRRPKEQSAMDRSLKSGEGGFGDLLRGYEIPLQNTCVEVIKIKKRKLVDALKEAQKQRADLLIMPRRAEPPRFTYLGTTNTVASFLLWLTTWIGGLHVQDQTFDARAAFDFFIINPYDGTTLATYTATSDHMDLTLWERNEREFQSGVGWSLIMPPYFAPDEPEPVSNMLSGMVCARIAARLGGYLKQDFVYKEHETIGTLRELNRKNGSEIEGPWLRLTGEIVADKPITDFALYVGDRTKPHDTEALSTKEEDQLATDQAQGSIYRIELKPPLIPLKIGQNLIRIEFAVQGRYTSRTLYYTRKR